MHESEAPNPSPFDTLGLSPIWGAALQKQGILTPTPIQESAIPALLAGQDVLAQSETGSGKTLAYLCPVMAAIDPTLRKTQAIVLVPTHELAVQVHRQAQLLAENAGTDIGCALLIGGASLSRQLEVLKQKPQLVIGSPGRILELIQRKKVTAHTVRTLILDEGDRLLAGQEKVTVLAVIKTTLRDRQIAVFSASLPKAARDAARSVLKPNASELGSTERMQLPAGLSHWYVEVPLRKKFVELRKVLAAEKPDKCLLFLNNPENIEVTTDKLIYHGFQAEGLYARMNKTERQAALEAFRSGRSAILVSSDLSARGLDIPGITHVIQMDIPDEAVQYLHRAGRTARGQETGRVISLAEPYDIPRLLRFARSLNITIQQAEMARGSLREALPSKKETKKTGTSSKNERKQKR